MAEIKDFARMCDAHAFCNGCPFEGKTDDCQEFIVEYTGEADRIITEWCKEHPQKTYAQDFLEKFPNAEMEAGVPIACRSDIYGMKDCLYDVGKDCIDCWTEVMPDA